MMTRYFRLVTLFAVSAIVVGCSSSTGPTTSAEQDELTKWVEENPSPPEVDPDTGLPVN